MGWGTNLEPGPISAKDILKGIGQLSGPLEKVLEVLKCENSQYVSI